MFINNFDPVAFQIFSFEIRWYSLAYIVGILLGWFLSKKFFISELKIMEKFDDYLTYLILGLIIGGRLGYVVFYNFEFYINNLLDIFKIWQGGVISWRSYRDYNFKLPFCKKKLTKFI